MAQNSVTNDYSATRFPFKFVSSEVGEALSGLLAQLEEELNRGQSLWWQSIWSSFGVAPGWLHFLHGNILG